MDTVKTSNVLPFVPLDRDSKNRQIDQELQELLDKERAKETTAMADEAIEDLDWKRLLRGDVT